MQKTRALALLALATLEIPVAPVALSACKRPGNDASAGSKQEAPVVKVQTEVAAMRPMPEYITLTGTLRASEQSDVAADASGKVTSTMVERGQSVKKGEVLAVLDARGASLSAAAAEAQANLAKSQLEQARRECDRVKQLRETGAISQAEFDRTTSQCQTQQWSLTAAQAQQQTATKVLGDTRIRAPFDGVIGERRVEVGQFVAPNTTVATIYTPDPLRLEITVPEMRVGAIKTDMAVRFRVSAYENEVFAGTVRFISPHIRPSTRDLVVEAVVANADHRLRPGMFAVAKLPLAEKPMPVISAKSVRTEEGVARAFVVIDKLAQERLIQAGEERDGFVGVTSGIKEGERVIVEPGPNVRDGARVE